MYDLASLTKVVVTTTLVEKLVEGDFPSPLSLDAPIERYLPEWSSGPQAEWRHKVTVRNLMTHTSGLPPFKEYWRISTGKADTLRMIFAEPLEYEPGTKVVYSDLGIILMAEIIQRLTGKPLDQLAREYIFEPLGMSNSTYNPPKQLWPAIAPTEIDNQLRHRLVQGEVHDENAYAIGGVSGHAGVFSTSPDLAAFCQMLLNGGELDGERVLSRSTIKLMTSDHLGTRIAAPFQPGELLLGTPGYTFGLGFAVRQGDGVAGVPGSAGEFMWAGYGGTFFWVDPQEQIVGVYMTQAPSPIRAYYRKMFKALVYQALVD